MTETDTPSQTATDDREPYTIEIEGRPHTQNINHLQQVVARDLKLITTWEDQANLYALGDEDKPQEWRSSRSIRANGTLMRDTLRMVGREEPASNIAVHIAAVPETEKVCGRANVGFLPWDQEIGTPDEWYLSLYVPEAVFETLWEEARSGRANSIATSLRLPLYGDELQQRHSTPADRWNWYLPGRGRSNRATAHGVIRRITPDWQDRTEPVRDVDDIEPNPINQPAKTQEAKLGVDTVMVMQFATKASASLRMIAWLLATLLAFLLSRGYW